MGRNSIRRSINEMVEAGDAIYLGDTSDPSIWFRISEDNYVTLFCPKVEMGQGTFTGTAQLVAEELEMDIDRIQVVNAESASGNIDTFGTGGSTSVAGFFQPLRELSAATREMIRIEGARKMEVSLDEATAQNGTIVAGSKSMTYGEVLAGVDEWTLPDVPPLKQPADYKYIGKPVPRVDLEEKVFGAPMFGMDAHMPDMLYGAVVRPTKIGAKFKGADITRAEGMPGVVKVVLEEDFVGVVAASQSQANMAKLAIDAKWDVERNWQTEDIEEIVQVGNGDPMVIQKQGKAKAMLEETDIIEATYRSPLGAHAQLEPNGAVAYVESDKATIIISTQVVKITRDEVADRLGLDSDQVNIVPTFLGGGFGRRLHTPNAVQAAVMSKAVGRPVKCFFDRQEEFQNDTFRPPTHHVLKAKLENGNILAIEHQVASGSVAYGSALLPPVVSTIVGSDAGAWRGGRIQYGGIPHFRAVSWHTKLPFATSWWRSLGLLANTFAIESFMDELAVEAGKDPAAFRMEHIQDDETGDRLKQVIEAAVSKANYKDEVVGDRAMGFAASTDAGTPVAQVVELSMKDGRPKIHKVTCAIDPGIAINPDQIRAQTEGCIMMGISASMYERMYVEDGELQPIIYGPYEMARLRDTPEEIDVIILENAPKPYGVGEPPLGPIGAAVANAMYRLTGERLRQMPLLG